MTPDQLQRVRDAYQLLQRVRETPSHPADAWVFGYVDDDFSFDHPNCRVICRGPEARALGASLGGILGGIGQLLRHVEALERQLAERTSG